MSRLIFVSSLLLCFATSVWAFDAPDLEVVSAKSRQLGAEYWRAQVNVRIDAADDPSAKDRARIAASLAERIQSRGGFQQVWVTVFSAYSKKASGTIISRADYNWSGMTWNGKPIDTWEIKTTSGRYDLYNRAVAERERLWKMHGRDYNTRPKTDAFIAKMARDNDVSVNDIRNPSKEFPVTLPDLLPLLTDYDALVDSLIGE